MKKFLIIMAHEYSLHVFRWRFLFSIMSLPILMAVALLVVYLVTPPPQPDLPIGIVDQDDFLATWVSEQRVAEGLSLVFFDTKSEASQALLRGEIQAYGDIPPGFSQSGHISLVSLEPLNPSDYDHLSQIVRTRILEGYPTKIINRLTHGNQLIVQNLSGDHVDAVSKIRDLLLPTLAVFVFMLAIFSTSGYLMQALTVEKENYTMELILTSVSHGKLLIGKLCGIMAIGFTQLMVWFGFIFIVISIGQRSLRWLESLRIPPYIFLIFSITLSLAFLMIASIMITVGATVAQATEGQQITGPFSLPFILPFLFTYQIMNDPNSPLAFWLSLFPFTSPITLIIRLSVTQLPDWQVILSLVIQFFFAVLLAWIAGRAFRVGMLQYGKRLSLRDILHSR